MLKQVFYDWYGGNLALFKILNAYHSRIYDEVILNITHLGDSGMFPVYLALMLLGRGALLAAGAKPEQPPEYKYMTFYVTVLMVLGYLFYSITSPNLKDYFGFPRPYMAYPEIAHMPYPTPYKNDAYHSLSSGHAMFSMVMLCAVWPVLNRWGKMIAALAVIAVGFSRIALAMHFPADVLGGWVVAVVAILVIKKIIALVIRFKQRKRVAAKD